MANPAEIKQSQAPLRAKGVDGCPSPGFPVLFTYATSGDKRKACTEHGVVNDEKEGGWTRMIPNVGHLIDKKKWARDFGVASAWARACFMGNEI